jgi:hypothetical protein
MAYNEAGNYAPYITLDRAFTNGIDFDWSSRNPGHRQGKLPIQVGWLNASGGLSVRGTSSTATLRNPAAPRVTQSGEPGTTSYTYYVVCHDYNGGVSEVSPRGRTKSGNGALSARNYNVVAYSCGPGWNTADILKGNSSRALASGRRPTGTIDDTGQSTTTYTPPSRNTTGDIRISGVMISKGLRWPLPMRVIDGASFYCSNCDPPKNPTEACTSRGAKTGSWVHGLDGKWLCVP